MRVLLVTVAAALLAAAAPAVASSPPALLRPGVLQVGAELPTPAFLSASHTRPTGYAADLVNAIARQLGGPKVAWREVAWATLWKPATPKTLDFDIDSITITSARARTVDFSSPYFVANLGLVVRRGSPLAQARTLKELRAHRLGAQSWALGFTYLQRLRPQAAVSYGSNPAALNALEQGAVDGLLVDAPVAISFARAHPNLVVASQVKVDQRYGLLFAKGSKLRLQVNAALAALRRNGTLGRIEERWFPGLRSLPVLR